MMELDRLAPEVANNIVANLQIFLFEFNPNRQFPNVLLSDPDCFQFLPGGQVVVNIFAH